MENKLNHLTSDEVDTLMQRYYDGESVSKLVKEYNISVHPSSLYKLFPPKVFTNIVCEYCKEPLLLNRLSRSMNDSQNIKRNLFCPVCGHKPYYSDCNCENCQKKKKEVHLKRIELIRKVYSESQITVDFTSLSFENKVYLGAICRGLLKEDLHEIAPLNNSNVKLTPTKTLLKKLYLRLTHNQIIIVSPNSSLDAFDIDSEEFPYVYYIYEATYLLNLNGSESTRELLDEILDPKYYLPENADEALILWKEIAVAECIEYLQYQLNKAKFNFSPGEKTYKTFDILLNDFSVSQIYGIIYHAVAVTSKSYLQKEFSSKLHAANSVIGSCQRYADRARINGWDLPSYNRIKALPQSILSSFYFDRVLGIGEKGFKIPPTIEVLGIH